MATWVNTTWRDFGREPEPWAWWKSGVAQVGRFVDAWFMVAINNNQPKLESFSNDKQLQWGYPWISGISIIDSPVATDDSLNMFFGGEFASSSIILIGYGFDHHSLPNHNWPQISFLVVINHFLHQPVLLTINSWWLTGANQLSVPSHHVFHDPSGVGWQSSDASMIHHRQHEPYAAVTICVTPEGWGFQLTNGW